LLTITLKGVEMNKKSRSEVESLLCILKGEVDRVQKDEYVFPKEIFKTYQQTFLKDARRLNGYWKEIFIWACINTSMISYNGGRGKRAIYIRTGETISDDTFYAEVDRIRDEKSKRKTRYRGVEAADHAQDIPSDVPTKVPVVFMKESEYNELKNTIKELAEKVDSLTTEISNLRKERNNAFDEVKDLSSLNRQLQDKLRYKETKFAQLAKQVDTTWVQDFRR
jgi:FtsZ-binding cell division protein ZapB